MREQSRMPEQMSSFDNLVEAAKKAENRERRNSGIRTRIDGAAEFAPKEKIPAPDPSEITAEQKDKAQALQLRMDTLLGVYRTVPGAYYHENTDDYLIARLSPSSPDYIKTHLYEMDGLLLRAKSEPRLLENVERAILAWEALNGELPTDFVSDGLEVDGHALLNLRDFISSFANRNVPTGELDEKVGKIMAKLKSKIPELVILAEKLK